MNFFQNVGLSFNKNNKKYIIQEIQKTNNVSYIKELIEKANPDIIDYEILDIAVSKGYHVNDNTPIPKNSINDLHNYIQNITNLEYLKFVVENHLLYIDFNDFYLAMQKGYKPSKEAIIKFLETKEKFFRFSYSMGYFSYDKSEIYGDLPLILSHLDENNISFEALRIATRFGYEEFENTPVLKFNTFEEIKKFFEEYDFIPYEKVQSLDRSSKDGFLLENERSGQHGIIGKIIEDNLDIMTYELLDSIRQKNLYWPASIDGKIKIKINSKEEMKEKVEKIKDQTVIKLLIDNSTSDVMSAEIFREAINKGYKFNVDTPKYIFEEEQYKEFVLKEKEKLYQDNDLKYIDYISPYLMDLTIFEKACRNGYKIDEKTPEYIKNNMDYVAIYIYREEYRLNEFVDLPPEQQEKLMFNLIEHNYRINSSTPEIYQKFKYIKEALKKDISHMSYSDTQFIYNSLNDNEKKEVESIILDAMDNKKNVNRIPKSLINFSFIKKLTEKGWMDVMSYPDDYLYIFSEEQQDELILTAIEQGYPISNFFSSNFKIPIKLEYIEKGFECKQFDIFYNSFSKFTEYIKSLSPNDQERLLFKLIDSGNEWHDNPLLQENKYKIRFMRNGHIDTVWLKINNLNSEEKKQLNEAISIAIQKGYRFSNTTPNWMKSFEFIKMAIERENNPQPEAIMYLVRDEKDPLTEEELELCKMAVQKGYSFNYDTPEWMKSFEFIKMAIERENNPQPEAIMYLVRDEKDPLTEEELELCKMAVQKGYSFNYDTPEWMKSFEFIKMAIERENNPQPEAIMYLVRDEKDPLTEEELELCKMAVQKGYSFDYGTPEWMIKCTEVIKYAMSKDKISLRNPSLFNINLDKLYNEMNFTKEEFKVLFEKYNSQFNKEDINIYLLLLSKYKKFEYQNESLGSYSNYLFTRVKQELSNQFKDEKIINFYLNQVFSGERNPLYFTYIKNDKDLAYVINYTDLKTIQASENNTGITFEILNKGNKKQIKKIIGLLRNVNVSEDNIPLLAINIYMSLEHQRAIDLLTSKYGQVNEKRLLTIFKNILLSDVLFEPEGKGFKPQINQQLINLTFGANYNISNTPIRNYLNDYIDKRTEMERLKEKIQSDLSLTSEEKAERIKQLSEQFVQYKDNLLEFFNSFGEAFNQWDIIEEELLKSQVKSKLKLKLNISKVSELCKMLETKRKIPDLEPRDAMLIQSDVFDYAFHDTQFVSDVSKVPSRILELSRRMENVTTKKIPNVEVKHGNYTMKVYGPQDRRLLSAGYRSHCCFRACGNADNSGRDNSLLNYCASTEYGGGVEIFDEQGKTIMFSPILRNGNVVMIHSVETTLGNYLPKECYELLVKFSNEIIKKSDEVSDDISFVTITDLHFLDLSFTEGTLPQEKKYHIYDEDKKFDGMYTNLDYNHMILAHKGGKKVDDIVYGPVGKDYEFDIPKVYVHLSVSEEEKKIIGELDEINGRYIEKANERYQAQKNSDEAKAYELLSETKNIKREYLIKYKELIGINKSTDIYADFKKGVSFVEDINRKLGKEIDTNGIIELTCSTDWYIIIINDNQIIANALPSGKEDLLKYLNGMKEIRNINTISGNYIEDESIKKM